MLTLRKNSNQQPNLVPQGTRKLMPKSAHGKNKDQKRDK